MADKSLKDYLQRLEVIKGAASESEVLKEFSDNLTSPEAASEAFEAGLKELTHLQLLIKLLDNGVELLKSGEAPSLVKEKIKKWMPEGGEDEW